MGETPNIYSKLSNQTQCKLQKVNEDRRTLLSPKFMKEKQWVDSLVNILLPLAIW